MAQILPLIAMTVNARETTEEGWKIGQGAPSLDAYNELEVGAVELPQIDGDHW